MYSRTKSELYVCSEWPLRETIMPGYHSVIYQPLVKKEKISLPPLHIKLSQMKEFTKAQQQNITFR